MRAARIRNNPKEEQALLEQARSLTAASAKSAPEAGSAAAAAGDGEGEGAGSVRGRGRGRGGGRGRGHNQAKGYVLTNMFSHRAAS